MISKNKQWPTPTPEEVKAARQSAGLTQAQAGAVIGVPGQTWRRYEMAADIPSRRSMPPQFWKLFQILAEREQS